MGFFQDLKEDLSQAVSELTPAEEEVVEEEKDLFAAAEESMGIEHTEEAEVEEDTSEMEEGLDSFLDEVAAAAEKAEEQVTTSQYVAEPEPVAIYEAEQEPSKQVSDETAIITRNMIVNGDVNSSGSLELMGVVNGNITVYGELNVTGEINGNSEASNIIATNCNVTGNMTSSGAIKVGAKAVIKGNIYATSAVISGAVKGDIDVHGPVILDSTAIVMGNIKSKAVQINNGAAIEGMCSQCYADVSPSAFFRD